MAIARGELRFGERLPNPFADGEMTIWFHPLCAAYKRPEALLQGLTQSSDAVPERERLEEAAGKQRTHRRLPRISGAERAPSSQAKCRSCRETIERGGWRIRLVFHEDGQFAPGGFIHLDCRRNYFETDDIAGPLLHFSAGLSDAERAELRQACGG